VRDFLFEPGIAGYHGYAENFRPRRLDQQQNGLLIGPPRSSRVLIDNDLSFAGGLLAPAGHARQQRHCDYHYPQPNQSHLVESP
jgi:hypothetical protein